MKTFGLLFVIAIFGVLGYSGYKIFIPHDRVELRSWSDGSVAHIPLGIEVDYDAPVVARDEIFIKAEPWRVFSTVKNVNKWTEWQSNISSAEMEERAEPGKKFKWAAGIMRIKSEFHTVKKFDSIGWTGNITGMKAIHNFRFKEVDGGTKVFVEESLDGWLPLLLDGFVQKELENGINIYLAELKVACEVSGKG
ncbi:MAG: hypothetical protein SCALA702_32710 [Melioribacteraceae bacterium]|nr:MAG: hypothetical protein SCALA702_32710 [Melioribacteraceae bacterium]